ncbi:condensation domain-containing protein [Actinomadura xylanilytica]|uniref:condensation domain-containing protein n=1 Tax=Actinomadura xylanilytica TaxID=887459 RepID=UPI00255AA9AA|nr:AMP-binding protein [Actinomadura xylanilytica]MDL4777812.1 AMP-binding protein [Actinomadura xylanilytica]
MTADPAVAGEGTGPVPLGDGRAGAPLSAAQERTWFLERIAPGAAPPNVSVVLRLTGGLDAGALRRAVREAARRHEVLRTGFVTVDGRPARRVADVAEAFVVDARPAGDIGERVSQARGEPFDLAAPPLLRAVLLRVADREHVLVLVAHPIAADARSMRILADEVAAGYAGDAAGGRAAASAPRLQYADFAAWQRGRTFAGELSYWRDRLAGAPAGPALPPSGRTGIGPDGGAPDRRPSRARERVRIPPDAASGLAALAAAHDASPFEALLAAFAVLLARFGGRDDIVVGTTVTGRGNGDLEPLVGPFDDVLPLRIDLADGPAFPDALARVRETVRAARANAGPPSARIVEELRPRRYIDACPLAAVTFDLDGAPAAGTMSAGVRFSPAEPPRADPRLPLAVRVEPAGGGRLDVTAVFHDDRFAPESVASLLGAFPVLLRGVAEHPDTPVHDVPLITLAHRRVLPEPARPPRRRTHPLITDLLEESTDRDRERPALVQGTRHRSYGDLSARAHELADALRSAGHAPGDVVAVATRYKCPDLYAALWAVWLAHGVLLLVDTALPPARRRAMVAGAGARTVLALDRESAAGAMAAPVETVLLSADGADVTAVRGGGRPGRPAGGRPGPDDPAYVCFTSGSTGTPKALLGRHNGLSHFISWQGREFGVGVGDRCAPLISLSADALLRDVLTPLTSGACLCLPSGAEALGGDAVLLLPWMRDAGITMAHTIPSLAAASLASLASPTSWPDAGPLDRLRLLFFAGEPLSGRLADRFRTLAPGAEVVNLYGASECTMVQTFHRVPPRPGAGRVPAGSGIPGAEIVLVTRGGTPCAPGEIGEAIIRTPYAALGYLDRRATGGYAPNPFRDDPSDVVFRTGDRGRYRSDGTVEILGRAAGRAGPGAGTDPEEVNAVLGTHPGVAASTVAGHPDLGGVAYVVLHPGRSASPFELRRFLLRACPPEDVPAAFVAIDRIPVTTIGKLDRRALPSPSGAPAGTALASPAEERVARVWSDLLGVRITRPDADFFDLGGGPALALRAGERMREILGRDVDLADIFRARGLREYAQAAETA